MKDGPAPMKFRTLWLGLAGLAGLGVAFATASVTAQAHESALGAIEDDGELYIDGKRLADRRFELLGDPLGDVVPPAPPIPAIGPAPPAPPAPASPAGAESGDHEIWLYDAGITEDLSGDFDADIAAFSADIAREGTEIARLAMSLAAAEIRGDTSSSAALEQAIDRARSRD